MGTSLVHPQRQSRQHAYSDRDVAYLEKQGWVREKPPVEKDEIVMLLPPSDPMVIKNKVGRPRKAAP